MLKLSNLPALEEGIRSLVEEDRHLGDPLRKSLSSADIDRHPAPSPVVDLKLKRDVGIGLGIRGDPLLLKVSHGGLASNRSLGVLSADRIRSDLNRSHPLNRSKDLRFLISDTVGVAQ